MDNDQRLRQQAALISLLVGMGMLILKTTAWFITQSSAILSDALESIVHIAATGMAYYSVVLSARPADRSHPYGHGKIEFFSAGVEGGLIIIAAIAIVVEAVRGIVVGKELLSLDTGMLLTLVAAVVNLGLGVFLIRRGRRTRSLTLEADGRHVLTDSWTSFGVVLGLVLVRTTGLELLDPLVAIAVAANILISGYKLIRVSVGGLMDESDTTSVEKVAAAIDRHRTPFWINVHQLRVLRSGQRHHVDFHVIIPFYWTVERAHDFHDEAEAILQRDVDSSTRVLVHLDPCKPFYCSMCTVDPCPERTGPCTETVSWDVHSLEGLPPKSALFPPGSPET
jgi:cation diffusion facilitator family transporter